MQVPLAYQLCGYQANDISSTITGYVPLGLARPLRTGAQDEIILVNPLGELVDGGVKRSSDVQQEEFAVVENAADDTPVCDKATVVPGLRLRPPQALFKSPVYPPLHIMVSMFCI